MVFEIAELMCNGDEVFIVGREEFCMLTSNCFQFVEMADLGGAVREEWWKRSRMIGEWSDESSDVRFFS